ncbi:MAG TPA: hypothetical protein VGH74_10030 [Planctomycetaceae bacterium]
MTIAFDPGAFAFRSLRRRGRELVARRCRTIAVTLADNEARRRWLERSNLPHLVAEGFLVLPGDAAVEAENLFGTIPRDLLPHGALPKSDPVTRQVIARLIDGMLPPASQPQEVCCFAQPGCEERMLHDDPTFDERMQFFSRIIRLRGYQPLPLNPAAALVLAELGSVGFTGVGIALGASGCDVAIVHQGRQMACGRLARAGRWIDEQIARKQQTPTDSSTHDEVLDVDACRTQKEAASLLASHDDVGRHVVERYENLIGDLVKVLRETLDSHPAIALLRQPLPLVCGGGPARIPGFKEALERELLRQEFPVVLAGLRLVAESEYSVARGCLIHATLDESALAAHDERRGPSARELANA